MTAPGSSTVLVTGAGRGIGAACARALDAAGHRVALVARSVDQLHEVASSLANDPIVVVADLAEPEAPAAVVAEVVAAFGGLGALVNNAAIGIRKPSDEITADEVDALLAVNVRAPLLLCAAALPTMVAAGGGSIVNISSISGRRGAPHRSAYAATKAAVDGMTRSLAMEFGPAGIRVNAVAPGVVATDLWSAHLATPGVEDAVLGVIPQRRLTTPEEVADVVAFLVGSRASGVTGEVLSVDGGMHGTINLWPQV